MTKVSDTLLNQCQQEDPIDDIDDAKMTVLSQVCTATTNLMRWNSSQKMTYLKNQTRSQTFNQPHSQPFSDTVRRLNHISERGHYTVQYNVLLPYHDPSEVVKNYDQNPPDVKTLSTRDAVSEMKRQLHFLD